MEAGYLSSRSDDIGTDLAAATMGMDALERRRSGGGGLLDGEGLVPIYIGEALAPARSYADWREVADDLDRLSDRVERMPAGDRQVFRRGMLRSLGVAARLFAGGSASFAEKVTDLVGAPPGPVDSDEIEGMRDHVDALLTRSGHMRGPIEDRVRRWEESRFLEECDLVPVAAELMEAARARTAAMIFDCGDYAMELEPVRGAAYTARCRFKARKMALNLDIRFTRAALKHLVCHEIFPGHATQLLSTRAAVEAGRADADALLVTANAVTGCVQEGIGDQGVLLLDWVENADDELHLELRRLRSAAQTTAAWRLMADGESPARVADYLRDTAIGQPAWIAGRIEMAAHPFRGPFIASYFAGNETVRTVRERVRESRRAAFVATLFEQAHSRDSLALFDGGERSKAGVVSMGESVA